ncbi:class I SAM-dependent methyltransferase [Streptomyces chartreusis]
MEYACAGIAVVNCLELDGSCSITGMMGACMAVRNPVNQDSIEPRDASHRKRPPDTEATDTETTETRRILARAGVRSGQRILDIGALLRQRGMTDLETKEFQVVGVREVAGTAARPHPVPVAPDLDFTVAHLDELDLPVASFDVVVALDFWPSTPLAVAARGWRRVLEPEEGTVIVTGTDLPGVHRASRQWTSALTAAGFTVEAVAKAPADSRHYAALASAVRLGGERLRAALGPGTAESYAAHVQRLHGSTRHESAECFEIVARSTAFRSHP